MKIYLDDLRNAPDESWVITRTPDDFRHIIERMSAEDIPIEAISFDNDLAKEEEGYDLLKWMVENYPEYIIGETVITVHSSNPQARENMEGLIKSCREHSSELLEIKKRSYPFGEIQR